MTKSLAPWASAATIGWIPAKFSPICRGVRSCARRLAAPAYLHRAESFRHQFQRLVGHGWGLLEAQAVAVVGGDRSWLAAQQPHQREACGDRERVPTRDVDGRDHARHRSGHPGEPEVPAQQPARRGGLGRGPRQQRGRGTGDRGRRAADGLDVAEQVGPTGHPLLGEHVDQQQGCGGDPAGAGVQRSAQGDLEDSWFDSAHGQPLGHRSAPSACTASRSATARLAGVATPASAPRPRRR